MAKLRRSTQILILIALICFVILVAVLNTRSGQKSFAAGRQSNHSVSGGWSESDRNNSWKKLYPAEQEDISRILVLASIRAESTKWVEKELSDILEPKGPLNVAVYVSDDAEAPLHPPANRGHESNVYLTYIIDHYDSLPDVVIFAHADQFAWHNNELLDLDSALAIRNLSPSTVIEQDYVNLRCYWDPGCPDWIHPVRMALSISS